LKTNQNAQNSRVVKIDINSPELELTDLLPQTEDVLDSVDCVYQNYLVAVYLRDVKSVLRIFDISKEQFIETVDIPVGIIDEVTGLKQHKRFFFSFVSFLHPGRIYEYDFERSEKRLAVVKEMKVAGLNPDDFTLKQEFYPSKDGTKVPMYILHRESLSLNKSNPTLLYGYGGFNISITPTFSPFWFYFVSELNGVFALANIRGGREYGDTWYLAGTHLNKQNVFDDFQYAARFLTESSYTQPSKLAITGKSNGGLLIGACINQAPELFGCAIAEVGVMDMLRFHKFTIGYAWKSDYGDPDKPEDFHCLYKYSPLHNVQAMQQYPATLLTTSDHDDRVVPLHSYKMIATLQENAKYNEKPLFIKIETKAGHGAGTSTQKKIDHIGDLVSFICLSLKI